MGAAAIPIAIALSAGATTYQIYSQKQAQKEQKREADRIANRPVPVGTPMPTMTDTNSADTAASRQRKLKSLQFGMASTITGKEGTSPAQILTPTATGSKTKLGQ